MKKIIIAEKPSLAMTIVRAIGGNFNKKDGNGTYNAYVIMEDTGTFVNFKLDFTK